MEGAFQACRNCKRSMAPAHLALHEAHCLLFLVLCPECKGPVPPAKKEEHCENGHQQATECPDRPVECKFCKLAVRLSKLEIHEHHCGNRTELCLHCGQPIMLQELAQHTDVCRGEQAQLRKGKRISAPESKIYCHYCNQKIPGNKYFHHMDQCRTVSESVKYFPVGEPRIPPPSLPSQAVGDQTSTAEKDVRPKMKTINRFPPLSEKSTKQAPRGTNKALDRPWKSERKPRSSSPVEDEAAYDMLRRCSQCGILLPLPTLNQHQEKCRLLAASKGKQARSSS
ncbi:PREDICTED: XIAP-associated factor 1 isoform X2 [Ceratotherium simum simum]|uniref:XIAP-associated factor 1 isoform X2 n=1 Tax=Ceratotherium simum simum TaxID=73337 RepID=A0ABM1D009_CERSS|nr:PREDICTED: XIAP-associated factor 1 isoform X2 [Ceratotherium simum simum]